ncbi:sulfur carrier protein ThiS [Sphingobacterium daejeonense]|jgi:sulfur carrier protein|uniref:Sulfur carrier protein ThiS n=1 Tax=Sphingobacterium daejeonense TaxID=371142 RepID=A0ABW3RP68_9SPHI|nr:MULTISPECIES: sulfur carrier protein ThiS [Sphingobacterium]MCT1530442.1 sulfur carrier protein ThiS [Sphingobacterium daejeonense]VTP95449.1 sulfur carrier protein ThiS [Sphingobacterium daejeonense]
MVLIINHQLTNFAFPINNLEELMHLELKGKTNGVAIALNNQVIPRNSWSVTPLADNDSILIITATQGG